jgi:acetyl-CoA acetyltransferase
MSAFPRGKTCIVGASTFGLGESPGFSAIELAARASLSALDDAGITLAEVDGVFVALPEDQFSGLSLSEYLGLHPSITDNNRVGGSSFQTHAVVAALALDAGLCNVALIAYGSNQRSTAGRLVTPSRPFPYEGPYRPTYPVSAYALSAARHMYQYGTTRRQLAEVAVAARAWAQLNPDAFARDPLTIDEVLGSRMVSDPLTVRDCCLVTDGAAAVVMTRADRARHLRQRPVHLLGGAAATTHRNISAMDDLTVTAAADSGRRAFDLAGLKPSDVDVLQLYDAFTINPILFLEDLGFCAKGEGGAFVEGGRIAPGGALPVNTNGGGLSCTHPGMYGLFTMVEATVQLRGEAGARQVKDAKVALAHGNGGTLSSQATLLLGTEDTV